MSGKRSPARSVVLGVLLLSMAIPVAADPSEFTPTYEENGQLKVPKGFDTWVFVGSNLGLSYKNNLAAMTSLEAERAVEALFHNVYLDPHAYKVFVETGEFADPTTLVMEIFAAADREPKGVLAAGQYNGDFRGLQVAVKDLSRPGRQPSGSAWAYYVFNNGAVVLPSAPAFPDVACANCHKAHASKDNVWVQFYPTLRKLASPDGQGR